ncbi:hypothetical protein EV126DRAFT_417732 [Verticillium dahliae]|nr:hypothetical protein EV126DRAFT_417732 [Verticillium dahliae]
MAAGSFLFFCGRWQLSMGTKRRQTEKLEVMGGDMVFPGSPFQCVFLLFPIFRWVADSVETRYPLVVFFFSRKGFLFFLCGRNGTEERGRRAVGSGWMDG